MSSCRFLSFRKFFDIEKESIYQYGDIDHMSVSEKDIFEIRIGACTNIRFSGFFAT